MKKLIVVLLLAGCSSPPITDEQGYAIIATYGPPCEAVGFQKGTDPWFKCMSGMWEQSNRRPNALGQGLTAAGGTLNPQLYQNNQAPYIAPIQNTRCNTTYMGTTCETTPY